jgi:hypothetical protein
VFELTNKMLTSVHSGNHCEDITMMSIDQLCEALEWGLQQESATPGDKTKKIRVKSVFLLNNITLVCEFFPYSHTSIEVKTEIGFIVSFLSAFFQDNPLAPSSIQHFAIRAFSPSGEEIMYAISSKQIAAYAAQERPIEWLRNTIFQDNSEDQRLLISKKKISELENTLRKVISDSLSKVADSNWWLYCINVRVRNDAETGYRNQNGMNSTDGEELIHYTYLPQLKTIITENWPSFSHIFPSASQIETWLTRLNRLRRDEAHNRPISTANLQLLEQIHSEVLDCIAKTSPDLVSNYLAENWRQRIAEILSNYSDKQVRFDSGEGYQLQEVVEGLQKMATELADVEIRLISVPIPPGKGELHNDLLATVMSLKNSFEAMSASAKSGSMERVEEAVAINEEARRRMRAYLQKYLLSEL